MSPSSAITPLTSSQLPLWLGQQLAPESPLYNMAMAIHLPAGVEEALFQRAWEMLAAENDALRLRFEAPAGDPGQVLGDEKPLLEVVDLQTLTATELDEWLTQRSRRPFDLDRSPVDSALLRTEAGMVWFLNQHHLITDAWGVTAQFQRLAELYQHLLGNEVGAGATLPSFLEYAEQKTEAPGTRTVAYWQEIAELLPARADFNRFSGQVTSASHRVEILVDGVLRQQIAEILLHPKLRTWTPQLTQFNVIATALIAFLHRLTNQSAYAVGVPAHNRISAQHKRTPGVFMELFPLLTEVSAQDTFISLYERVRDANYNFLRHAKPGAGSRGLARGYNVVLNFINTPFGDFAGQPVSVDWIHPQAADAGHDLRLLVYDFSGAGQPTFCFELNESTFSPRQRAQLPRQFAQLLKDILRAPEALLGQFPLAETDFPEPPPASLPEYDHSLTVLDLLEQVPEAELPALQQGSLQLSYADMHQRVARLADYLIESGVRPGDLVPVLLNRTVDYVISVLAIHKAGAAFVPVAVTNPAARVAQLLGEISGRVILTHSAAADLVPKGAVGVIWLDQQADLIAARNPGPGRFDACRARPDDLAYVLYTSGSTGRPKGVMITHQALSLYLQYARATYARGLPVTAPLFTSIGFDLTITTTFLPLITGGTLRLYPVTGTGPDLSLLEVLRQGQIDFLKLTPSHLRLLSVTEATPVPLKALVVGGENFTVSAAKTAERMFGPSVSIYNEYGPTEATVGCVVHKYVDTDEELTSVPIGEAMPFTGTVLLDAFRNPVPDGVIGQLYLEGKTLARGYFKRPEITAAAFVVIAGRRFYATGDLVSHHPEAGYLLYHGRTDEQLKIGGQRVEPAEIAEVLEQQRGITSAVVISSKSIRPEAEELLLAYCIGPQEINFAETLAQVRRVLPLHMVPQRIIQVAAFPVTANGKVDHAALPFPEEATTGEAHTYVPPRDEFDDLIAGLWSAVFQQEKIGIRTNFFDLGGDSLKGIRIISLLNDELELGLPVNLIFRYPTIVDLSDYVQEYLRKLLSEMEQ